MPEGTYELVQSADGYIARIHSRGAAVLATPTINRGTAFTLAERRELGLTGLLPSGVSTLDGQLRRTYAQYRAQANDLRKWVYLANLRDRNEVLFYRLLSEHIEEMLPIVYTPTVGSGDRAVQPRVPPPARGVPVGRPPRRGRDRAAQHRAGRRGRRPAGGHRLRGHPRHRRPGRRRHRDLRRQARGLHRRGRHPPAAGCCRWCSTWAPTTSSCSTTRCTWASGTPGSATSATTS